MSNIDEEEIKKLLNESTKYLDNKEYKKSLEYTNKVIKLKPNEASLHNQKAYIYYLLQNYDKAIESCNKSIKLGSALGVDYYTKSIIYIKQEKYKKAINQIKKIIEYVNKHKIYSFACHTFNIFNLISGILSKNDIEQYICDLQEIIEDIIEVDKKSIPRDDIQNLYKYKTYNERALENIINGTLTLSDYNYFNDPADPPIKLKKDIFDKVKSVVNKIKIAALSNCNDNILMWSHYADSHKGICIKYDLSTLDKEKYILKKVKYTKILNFYENDDVFLFQFSNSILNTYFLHFLSLFYTKYEDWEYENEYRIIHYNNENDKKFINIELKIKAIYLGKDATCEAKDTIYKLIEGKNIALYKMKTDKENLFKLNANLIK